MNSKEYSPLPVILVTGFLGAGKTTLMRRLIIDSAERGMRPCVIVNEFGDADVDSNILATADAELLAAIAGGCACCSGEDDFHAAVQDAAARPDGARPKVLLVEASGLADPVLLLEILTSNQLRHLVKVTAIVCVVDAGVRDQSHGAEDLKRRQLALASLIVLNKSDLAESKVLLDSEELLREKYGSSQIVIATECDFDLDLIWQGEHNKSRSAVPPSPKSAHTHAHTAVVPMPHPVEEKNLKAILENLPSEVWRVKGFVRIRRESGLRLVQYSSGRLQLAPFHPGFGMDEPVTELVFIGESLDETTLRKNLQTDWG